MTSTISTSARVRPKVCRRAVPPVLVFCSVQKTLHATRSPFDSPLILAALEWNQTHEARDLQKQGRIQHPSGLQQLHQNLNWLASAIPVSRIDLHKPFVASCQDLLVILQPLVIILETYKSSLPCVPFLKLNRFFTG